MPSKELIYVKIKLKQLCKLNINILGVEDQDMALISVTRLRLRSVRYLPGFAVSTLLSLWQAKRSPNCFSVRLIQDSHLAFWTISAWPNEKAMRDFMTNGSHRQAMPKLVEWCDEAAIVHWNQSTTELPTIQEAHRRMQAEGRPSKVKYPSADQVAYQIATPRTIG